MGSRGLLLIAALCLAGFAACSAAPAAVIYLNTFNIGDVDKMVASGAAYTHYLMAFWTQRFGPVDAALTWSMNNLGDDPGVRAAKDRGVRFVISCGGATESPQFSTSGAAYGRGVAEFALANGFDGVDFDIEGFAGGNDDGTGTSWLVEATREAKRVFPGAIITHAPQAPYFTPQFTANYLDVEAQVGSMIDFYNIQFYNQGGTTNDTYVTLFERANGWSAGTSVMEIASNGIPMSKIVVGKPVTKAGVVNSGFVEMNQLAGLFGEAASKGTLPGGFMGWQWSLDIQELGGTWAQTLSAAWTGASSIPTSQPSSSPSPDPAAPIDPDPVTPTDPSTGTGPCTQDYTVVAGDSLWAIGQKYGVAWAEIYDANRDTMPDANTIYVGQHLRIPVPCNAGNGPVQEPVVSPSPTYQPSPVLDPSPIVEPPPVTDPSLAGGNRQVCTGSHLVQPGQSVYVLGDIYGIDWQEIIDVNRDRVAHPSQEVVGHTLRIPCASTADAVPASASTTPLVPTYVQEPVVLPTPAYAQQPVALPGTTNDGGFVIDPVPVVEPTTVGGSNDGCPSTHLVQPGESVYELGKMYNMAWEKIFDANRDKLADPSQIVVGHRLIIPC